MHGFTAFKYVGAERAVQCLKGGTLYLASPDQLNDALEARFNTASTEAYLAIQPCASGRESGSIVRRSPRALATLLIVEKAGLPSPDRAL